MSKGFELKFNCTGCAGCCKRVGQVIDKLTKKEFPYGVKEDGSCDQLLPDGKCNVYDTRPAICRVAKMYHVIGKTKGMTKREFFLQEAKTCNTFVEQDGLPEHFKIDLKQYQ